MDKREREMGTKKILRTNSQKFLKCYENYMSTELKSSTNPKHDK